MNQFIYKYFNAERAESLLFVTVGIIAILFGIYFLSKTQNQFLKGASYPIIGIALIQITVGAIVFFRTPSDIKNAEVYLLDKAKIGSVEIPRMEKVMGSFSLYKKIEIALVIIGLFLFFVFKNSPVLRGLGFGLLLQASIMLALDLLAEARGKTYLENLIREVKENAIK